jgi:hypothetical protein
MLLDINDGVNDSGVENGWLQEFFETEDLSDDTDEQTKVIHTRCGMS